MEIRSGPWNDGRWKILFVRPDDILDVIGRWRSSKQVSFPAGPAIPQDAIVVDMFYDPYRKQMGIRLWSASFDVQVDGDPTPAFDVGEHKFETYRTRIEEIDGERVLIVEGK